MLVLFLFAVDISYCETMLPFNFGLSVDASHSFILHKFHIHALCLMMLARTISVVSRMRNKFSALSTSNCCADSTANVARQHQISVKNNHSV